MVNRFFIIRRISDSQRGFSLIESMWALLVLGLGLSAMSPAMLKFSEHNRQKELTTYAIQAAQIHLDELRLSDVETLPSSGQHGPEQITVGPHTFDVLTSYCEDASFCPTAYSRHITVEVEFNDKRVFKTQTVYTRLR